MQVNDDPRTLEALQVLADAVRRERIPGVVEFRQLEDALKSIAEGPTPNRWATADAAFNALDPDLRQRVADRAHQLAHKEAKTRRALRSTGPITLEGAAIAAGAPAPLMPASPPPSGAATVASGANTDEVKTEGEGRQHAKPKRNPSASPFLAALNRGKLGAR